MSLTRWVLPRASFWALLATFLGAATASAQFYEATLRSLDLGTGSVARSPRLLGMGGLSLAVPDRDAAINLWDFSGFPVGLASDDSVSTLDFRPGTRSLSSTRALSGGGARQNLAARGNFGQFEGVYRNRESGSSFGVVGDVSSLRWDRPYAETIERRQGLVHPEVMPILGGTVPRFLDGHLAWAAHMRFRGERAKEQYRSIVVNAAGEFIGQGGEQLPPPSEFTPSTISVATNAYGLSTAYSLGSRTRFALGIERENNVILSTNELQRTSSEIREPRPYWIGRAAWVGGLGHTFEYGVDGTGRLSDSEADWRFTTSAGVGADPLTGRGNMFTRAERSSELNARARWLPGRATLAGALTMAAHEITIDPPSPFDASSFNLFINSAFNRTGTDSLAFPDSIGHGVANRFALGWGGGASYRLGTTTLGAEAHWSRDVRSTTVLGAGPRRVAWDVRAGLEHPLGKLMQGRVGYVYRSVDEDTYTAGNESTGNALSMGFGYAPVGVSWGLESGYSIEFRNQDQGESDADHQSRQNLALQLHWRF
jgi:hypothetical protein